MFCIRLCSGLASILSYFITRICMCMNDEVPLFLSCYHITDRYKFDIKYVIEIMAKLVDAISDLYFNFITSYDI